MKQIFCTLFSLLLLINLSSCFFESAEIKMVKAGHLSSCPENNLENNVNNFFGSPKWESIQGADGTKFVNIKGKISFMDKPVSANLQLKINDDGKSFVYQAFELNDIPQNRLMAMGLIKKLCGQ
jgi:hypothetical protein